MSKLEHLQTPRATRPEASQINRAAALLQHWLESHAKRLPQNNPRRKTACEDFDAAALALFGRDGGKQLGAQPVDIAPGIQLSAPV